MILILGPEESDPVNLYYGIVQALPGTLKDGDWSSLLDYPTRTLGLRDPVGFYREWIRGPTRFISVPVLLAP